MNSLNFPDTKVGLELVWGRHSHSAAAREWFESCGGARFLFCHFTQIALLRLLTAKSAMGRDTKTMPQAWDLYKRCRADDRQSSPKLWADAYLGAFTAAAGLTLITL